MSDLGTIVRDHMREQEIAANHEALCEKLTGIKSKLLTHNAMYQILENIRKEHGHKKDCNHKHKRMVDKLYDEHESVKKELFLFRLKHGLKHD